MNTTHNDTPSTYDGHDGYTGHTGYDGQPLQYIAGAALPPLLSEIPDKPAGMWMCGNTSLLNRVDLTYICIIGSRKYSSYGQDVCRELIEALKGKPVAIVSGLALGIDSIAHRTALDVGLPCIAVPGSGLHPDVLYPRSHVQLAHDIVHAGGVLISEYEPSHRAAPWTFPMRNRIMAGLSHAVLVVEGEEDSGTLITARLALEYNRDVLSVPGSIFSPTSQGPLRLIQRGARVICSGKDLLDALGFTEDLILRDQAAADALYAQCSEEELVILQKLTSSQSKEQLLSSTSFPLSRLQVLLSMLEIRGLIVEELGVVRRKHRIL